MREREKETRMAFFEQIGKRLTDVGQGVAQQTKNFTDVTRLNSVISEKERKISQLYAMLGQAYYEQHREDPAAEEAQTIEELNRTFAEIRQCQEEIRQIKGAVKCPNCGADAAPDALFCNACGARRRWEKTICFAITAEPSWKIQQNYNRTGGRLCFAGSAARKILMRRCFVKCAGLR